MSRDSISPISDETKVKRRGEEAASADLSSKGHLQQERLASQILPVEHARGASPGSLGENLGSHSGQLQNRNLWPCAQADRRTNRADAAIHVRLAGDEYVRLEEVNIILSRTLCHHYVARVQCSTSYAAEVVDV